MTEPSRNKRPRCDIFAGRATLLRGILAERSSIPSSVVSSCSKRTAVWLVMICVWLASPQDAGAQNRAWIGLGIVDVWQAGGPAGVSVVDVTENSPAYAAGIMRGDLIAQIDGRAVESTNDLICTVLTLAPGAGVRLLTIRGTELRLTMVKVGHWPEDLPQTPYACPLHIGAWAGQSRRRASSATYPKPYSQLALAPLADQPPGV